MPIRRTFRVLAQRVIAAYRTVSLDAAALLAKIPPLPVAATARQKTYMRIKEAQNSDTYNQDVVERIREEEEVRLLTHWELYVASLRFKTGIWTKEGIVPNFKLWTSFCFNQSSYRISQLLTGHGSFNDFLFRIKKLESGMCTFCFDGDSARHTLFVCPA